LFRDHCACCRGWWQVFYEERALRRAAEDRLQQVLEDPVRHFWAD
jgi:hypothetical protein